MATFIPISSKASVGTIINYVSKKEKTEEKIVSGINCSDNPQNAITQMKYTKKHFKKTGGRQYKHFVQSFSPEDSFKLSYEKAHQLGRELAEKHFKGHEVFIATHKDTDHIHNHIVINSVNYENGLKWQDDKKFILRVRQDNDKICLREGLSIPEPTQNITDNKREKFRAILNATKGEYKSYLVQMAVDLDDGLDKAKSKEELIKILDKKGYIVKWEDNHKYITFIRKENIKQKENKNKTKKNKSKKNKRPQKQSARTKNLSQTFKEERFTKEGIINELQRNKERYESERARGNKEFDGGTKPTNTRINTNADRNNGVTQTNARLHQSTLGRRNDKKDISTRGNESVARPNERYKGTDKDLIEQAKRDIARREQENRDGVKHIINGNERNEQTSLSENVAGREYDKSKVIEDRPEHKRENGKHKTRDKYRGR